MADRDGSETGLGRDPCPHGFPPLPYVSHPPLLLRSSSSRLSSDCSLVIPARGSLRVGVAILSAGSTDPGIQSDRTLARHFVSQMGRFEGTLVKVSVWNGPRDLELYVTYREKDPAHWRDRMIVALSPNHMPRESAPQEIRVTVEWNEATQEPLP